MKAAYLRQTTIQLGGSLVNFAEYTLHLPVQPTYFPDDLRRWTHTVPSMESFASCNVGGEQPFLRYTSPAYPSAKLIEIRSTD